MSGSVYAAAASALGYLYQLRYGLLVALQKQKTGLDWSVSIEGADDLESFGAQGYEVRQLKHRAPDERLTNASTDLWKTIRVWSDGVRKGSFDPSSTSFILITTATVAEGSIAAKLVDRSGGRDTEQVVADLLAVAETSTNTDNQPAYEAFRSLETTARTALVASIICVPASPNIEEALEELRGLFRVNTRPEHLTAYVERVEGWWFERSIKCLTGQIESIEGSEVDEFLADLRDQFQPTNLPIDADVLEMDHPELDPHSDRTYVRQLLLVRLGNYRLQAAVYDYLRAYAQRSRWVRDGFLVAGELKRYERRLKEEWALQFHRWQDELTPEAAEAEKLAMAQHIYAWAEDASSDPIRRDCTESFVTRGSLHMLADKQDIGWHPDYVTLLRAVLEPTGGDGTK